MHKRDCTIIATLLAFLVATPSIAATIHFNELVPIDTTKPVFGPPSCTVCNQLSVETQGFVFEVPESGSGNSNHAHLASTPYNASGTFPAWEYYPTNGSQYIGLDMKTLVMKPTDSNTLFSLKSIDAAEGFLIDPDNTGPASASPVGFATSLNIIGTLFSGGTVNAEFGLDGVNDSSLGGNEDFQTLSLPSSFTGLTEVMLSTDSGVFSVDNIELSVTTVPLPGAFWLFGTALLGLFASFRSKQ